MGNLQGKIGEVDVQRLDELALDFAKYFLNTPAIDSRTINLYGEASEVLEYIMGKMRTYFEERAKNDSLSDFVRDKAKSVSVCFGTEGYSIDVGRFIR